MSPFNLLELESNLQLFFSPFLCYTVDVFPLFLRYLFILKTNEETTSLRRQLSPLIGYMIGYSKHPATLASLAYLYSIRSQESRHKRVTN